MAENVLKKEFKEKDVQRLRNLVQGKYGEKATVGTGYTKQYEHHEDMENEFYSSLLKDKKTRLLTWITKGDSLVFPQGNNPSKELTKKIIKTILGNAKIKYDIAEKES